MSRHPFSRRAHRRKRNGPRHIMRQPMGSTQFAKGPGSRFFSEGGDAWLRLTPRFRKLYGRKIIRWSLGRRDPGEESRPTMVVHIEKPFRP